MRARLRRLFEPDGLGLGWRLAWWLPWAAGLGLLLVTNYSGHGPWRGVALVLFVVSGVMLFVVNPLVIWRRRRNGWSKVKVDGRWRWLRPGDERGQVEGR